MSLPLGDLLPFAVGIAISPIPIIAVILMLFTPKARVNGSAFAIGWVLGLLGVAVAVMALSSTLDMGTTSEPSTSASLIRFVLGLSLLFLAYRNWQKQPAPGTEVEMPRWMAGIDAFTPIKAFGLAAFLSGLNPKNLLLNVAAVTVIVQAGITGSTLIVTLVVYLLIASVTVIVPVVYYLVGGEKAQKTLDGWKVWLAANNAVVMAILLLVIGLKLAGDGLGALIS